MLMVTVAGEVRDTWNGLRCLMGEVVVGDTFGEKFNWFPADFDL